MEYQVKLESFEGPLDLLLYLIKKSDIDVYDIPIAEITAQYLQYIEIMKEFNLNVAGEFIVMAATLTHIKSEMLLPKPELEEEEGEEDPRTELVKKLLEYKKIKEAAKTLQKKELTQRDIFARSRITFKDEDYTVEATLFDLLDAFQKIAIEVKEEKVKEIIQEEASVDDKIKEILQSLKDKKYIDFSEIFRKGASKIVLIVSFLALLELTRQKKVFARQSKIFGNIRIYRGEMKSE